MLLLLQDAESRRSEAFFVTVSHVPEARSGLWLNRTCATALAKPALRLMSEGLSDIARGAGCSCSGRSPAVC